MSDFNTKLNKAVVRVDGEKGEWTFKHTVWGIIDDEIARIHNEYRELIDGDRKNKKDYK